MTTHPIVKPILSAMKEDQIDLIHNLSLQILNQVGIRVDSSRVLNILEQQRGGIRIDGNRAYLPAEVVEWAIDASPPAIEIYNRFGNEVFRLGDDRTRFGVGVTTLYYMDVLSSEIVPFTRKNTFEAVRLADGLPYFDVISTPGIPQDVPAHLSDLYGTLEMIACTTKPLIILVSDRHAFPAVLDLIQDCCGDITSKPFVLPYFNPLTPLVLPQDTADNMFTAIERGLPIIYSSYGMVGASTPITMTDTFALLNAELLAGLTITQLIKEGTPIILGPMPAFFDMKTMVSFYDTHSMILNLAFAELMAHYRIPHCGTSGSTTGWGPDILSTGEQMMNHLTCLMGKVGLAPFVGSLHDGKVFSLENMIQAHEIIAKAIRFSMGLSIDEAQSDLDELSQVGPGGNFLTTERTIKLHRNTYEASVLFPHWSLETWQEFGSPTYEKYLKKHTSEMVNALEPLEEYERLIAKGERFIDKYDPSNATSE